MRIHALAGIAAAVFCGACQPSETPRPAEPLETALQADGLSRVERAGQRVFGTRCATCHGERGAGDGQNAYTLEPAPPDFREALPQRSPAYWRDVVQGGTASVNRSPLCPPWGRSLAQHEVDAVVAYLGVLARDPEDAPASGR